MNPKLSIITINLNNKAGLVKTVQSVIDQSFSDYELLVIDGLSSDGSVEAIRSISNSQTKILSEKDSGIYNAMNKGIRLAKGEYLQFLNSGDYILDGSVLAKLEPFFNGVNELVYGPYAIENKNGERALLVPEFPLTLSFLQTKTINHQSTFFHKKLFQEFGMYDESFKIAGDIDFLNRILAEREIVQANFTEIISVYNLEGISSKSESAKQIELDYNRIREKLFSQQKGREAIHAQFNLFKRESSNYLELLNKEKDRHRLEMENESKRFQSQFLSLSAEKETYINQINDLKYVFPFGLLKLFQKIGNANKRIFLYLLKRFSFLKKTIYLWKYAKNSKSRKVYYKTNRQLQGDSVIIASFHTNKAISKNLILNINFYKTLGWNIIVSSTSEIDPADVQRLENEGISFIISENKGYDFGSWKIALEEYGFLGRKVNLILANDSVIPVFSSMSEIQRHIELNQFDFYGMSESLEKGRHIQSYFRYFSSNLTGSGLFKSLILGIKYFPNELKDFLIDEYEVQFSRKIFKNFPKFSSFLTTEHVAALVKKYNPGISISSVNPTLHFWSEIIQDYQFPFLKKDLLKRKEFHFDKVKLYQNLKHSKTATRWEDLNEVLDQT